MHGHLKIHYSGGLPEGIRALVEPLVLEFGWLLPAWVTELRVLWSEEVDGAAALMETSAEYRFCKLVVRPDFIATDFATQREYIVHEMIHPALQATKLVQHELLEALDVERENPALARWACEQIRKANEAATQDLADALLRREALGA